MRKVILILGIGTILGISPLTNLPAVKLLITLVAGG